MQKLFTAFLIVALLVNGLVCVVEHKARVDAEADLRTAQKWSVGLELILDKNSRTIEQLTAERDDARKAFEMSRQSFKEASDRAAMWLAKLNEEKKKNAANTSQ